MQVALIIIGAALVISGLQGTQGTLGATLASDLSGAGSFWYFIIGIAAAGAIGYYEPFGAASKLFLFLIILVLLLKNQGFFSQLQAAIAAAPTTGPAGQPLAVPTANSAVTPSTIPGVPGISSNPFAGLPSGLTTGPNPFFTFPSLSGGGLINPGGSGADLQSLP